MEGKSDDELDPLGTSPGKSYCKKTCLCLHQTGEIQESAEPNGERKKGHTEQAVAVHHPMINGARMATKRPGKPLRGSWNGKSERKKGRRIGAVIKGCGRNH